ncbi:hypothetical protein CMI37_37860 [Candidatus Pacearchaeota archaeon]|jgi:hypothetical protein|nr:hypothetical protein [Candidatus Pacearchaeota archaeon]
MHSNTTYTGPGSNEMQPQPWDIECIKTRGINIQKNMLGDVINIHDVVTQVFEIFFVNPLSSQDLGKWISMINNYQDLGTWQTKIDLYGIEIDNCRIINESASTSSDANENAVGRGNIRLEIEQRICGDGENIKDHDYYKDFFSEAADGTPTGIFNDPNVCPYLDGISEDFTFNYGKGEQVDITHSISITPFDSCPTGLTDCYECKDDAGAVIGNFMADSLDAAEKTCIANGGKTAVLAASQADCAQGEPGQPGINTPIDPAGWITASDGVSELCRPGQYNIHKALQLARRILDTKANIPAFGLRYQAGQYKDIQVNNDIICYYTETQNLITGECSMSKKISLLTEKDAELDWTATYKHSLTLTAEGTLNVTESGKVKGNKKCLGDGKNVNDATLTRAREGMEEWLAGDPEVVAGDPYGAAAVRCSIFYDAHFCNFTGPWNDCCNTTTTTTAAPATTSAPTTTPRPAIRDDQSGGTTTTTVAPAVTTTTAAPCSPCPTLNKAFPLELSKNINGIGGDVSYSITFTDDPEMTQGYFASRTLKASKDSSGVITINENCDLTQFQDKGSDVASPYVDANDDGIPDDGPSWGSGATPDGKIDNPWEVIYPEDRKGQAARVKDFYNSLKDFDIRDDGCADDGHAVVVDSAKLKSTTVSYNPNGRTLSYSSTWAGDPSISCTYPDPNGIRKAEIETEDKLPQRIKEEYPIIQWKMMVHDPKQTDIGERSVSVKAFLDRVPNENRLADPKLPSVPLKHMSSEIVKKELQQVFDDNDIDNIIEDDMYIKLCQWSFDSKGSASFTAAVNYLQKR